MKPTAGEKLSYHSQPIALEWCCGSVLSFRQINSLRTFLGGAVIGCVSYLMSSKERNGYNNMEIKHAEFIRGVVEGDDFWEQDIPQIIFYGRSNSGKSSSINALLNRNSLARPSGTPGKTREANFYHINNSFYVVDLPGYGYAKISKPEQEKLRQLILWFIGSAHADKRVHVIVMDAKVGPTELDQDMLDILREENQGHVIVLLNKTDKLNQKELAAAKKKAEEMLPAFVDIIPFSATKKKGVEKFWEIVEVII